MNLINQEDITIAFTIAIVMLVIESLLIYLFPVTKFDGGSVLITRLFFASAIVVGCYLIAILIQKTSFAITIDISAFLTGFLVIALELVIYNKYSLQGFKNLETLDPFNKILGKFAFTVVSVFIAKGFYKKI